MFGRASLEGGSAAAAQHQFPEGYYFSYVLYGLAWTGLAASGQAEAVEARAEARWALDALETPAGTGVFDATLTPAYGVFYSGWTLLLRAQRAGLSASSLDHEERARLEADADLVASAFEAQLETGGSPFLMAYPGRSWPVDSVVAMAALRQVDKVIGTDHGEVVELWLQRSSEMVDPRTGLLPHETDPASGTAIVGPRGSSQSIIQRMWPMVDPVTAADSYQRFRDVFVSSTAGFVGVREYPEGVEGRGDIDSGPLLLGFSASASVVAIGSARANGDAALAVALLHEVDVFGVPLTIGNKRRYALGALPIGDAFVAWARAAPLAAPTSQDSPTTWWPAYLFIPWSSLGLAWATTWRRRIMITTSDREPSAAGPIETTPEGTQPDRDDSPPTGSGSVYDPVS
jgi:hypothetical protein